MSFSSYHYNNETNIGKDKKKIIDRFFSTFDLYFKLLIDF